MITYKLKWKHQLQHHYPPLVHLLDLRWENGARTKSEQHVGSTNAYETDAKAQAEQLSFLSIVLV